MKPGPSIMRQASLAFGRARAQRARQVLVLGTSARGGIQSVIAAYAAAGFYSPGHVRFIASHAEGGRLVRLRAALVAGVSLLAALLGGRVDLLHLHMSMRGSFWRKFVFLNLARVFRVPAIVHLHGSEFAGFYAGSPAWVQRAVRALFDRAAGVVVLSESWREFVHTLTRNRVEVIGNFVQDDYDGARAARTRQPRNLLFLGQFGPRKGIFELLSAVAEVARAYPDVRLHCAGNGDVAGVRQRVRELGLEASVNVVGWVSGAAKADLLHACGIFVLPSHNEGLPMSIIEAMAHAMPVISTPVGGIPALVSAENGALVEPGDVAGLAQALADLLGRDDTTLAVLGRAARQRYETAYAPAACLGRMRALYQRIGVTP